MKKTNQPTPFDGAEAAASAPEDAPLAHLSDQVMVAAALDKALDGTALWVLLGLYRAYAVLDRDQA